jgi:hypothetical protein
VFKRALGLVVAIVSCFVLASGAAATTNSRTGTSAEKVTKINVATRAAVVHYLRSIHVSAKHAVIQRGGLNYAGARCPGEQWTCASTKHTVVQIAKPGGQNRFVCRRSHCAVVQISGVAHGVYMSGRQSPLAAAPSKPGGGNAAACVKTGSGATTGTGQSCAISQVGGSGPNVAGVYENTQKVSGLTQAAQYTAVITQQATGLNQNQACVTQLISLDGSTSNTNTKPLTVTLKAHQSVIINQDAPGGGMNRANQPTNSSGACISGPVIPAQQATNATALTQSQTLSSSVNTMGNVTQNLDRNDDPFAQVLNPSPLVTDSTTIPCAPNQGDNSDTANMCIDVEQNQGTGPGGGLDLASGPNSAVFWQENYLSAVAHTVSGRSINQIQGAQKDGVGGLLGTINQDSSGPSNFVSTQNETQCEDALPTVVQIPNNTPCSTAVDGFPAGVTGVQNQYGPEGVGNADSTKTLIHAYRSAKDPTTSSQTRGGVNDTYAINQTSKQNNDTNAIQNNHILGGLSTPGSGTITQNAIIQGDTKSDVQTGGGTNFQSFINCDGTDPNHPKVSCSKTLSKPKIETKPTNPTVYGINDATFTFSNSDSTVKYACKLDGATSYTLCNVGGTGSFSYPNLPSGSHTLSVKTQDADNGNQSADDANYTWVITPPDPTITSGPDLQTTSTDATFTFHDADPTANFVCELDDAASYTACPSTVSHGPHTLKVKAIDQAGDLDNLSTGFASYSWEVIPYLTFEVSDPFFGASAGWSGAHGSSSIDLTTGSDSGTYAQFTIHDLDGIAPADLVEPTFTTATYSGGSPRYDIDFSDDNYVFGYPSNAGFGIASWELVLCNPDCASQGLMSWTDVQTAEGSATVTNAVVEADWPPSSSAVIDDFTYDGYQLSDFTD